MEYKIYLGWKNVDANERVTIQEDWYDECFRKSSPELYLEIVRSTEEWLISALNEYGPKEYIYHYAPYTFIRLHCDGKVIDKWSVKKFLKERGYKVAYD